MSRSILYGSGRRRPLAEGLTALDRYDERCRRRAARSGSPCLPGELTLDRATDPEHLLETLRRLAAEGGQAAGRDRIRPADLGPREAASIARGLSAVLRRGAYKPAGRRRVHIPKVGRPGTRAISIPTLADRLVSAALHGLLEPTFDRTFLPGSHGFRRGRGTWGLLVALERAAARSGTYTLAVDDVGSAFDSVPIASAMEGLREHLCDPGLLALIGR